MDGLLALGASRPVSGSTASGRYTRFPDGTMVCAGTLSITCNASAKNSGIWTYPTGFLIGNVPVLVATTCNSVSPDMGTDVTADSQTVADARIWVWNAYGAQLTFLINLVAIGRWR